MSQEWALYGQVGVRLCRSLATGGVSEGAWLTHVKANLLLVMVLCCCLEMLTTNVTSAHGLALCPLSSTPTERRSVLFCAMRFLPMVLGEKRDSVISTCTSGPTWRISTGWLMLGLFNISEFTFCKLSFTSRSAYLPTRYLQLLPA